MSCETVSLLPCPFCGGEANAYVMAGDAVVECTVCSAELTQGVEDENYHDTSAIIARWNSRSKPAASIVRNDAAGFWEAVTADIPTVTMPAVAAKFEFLHDLTDRERVVGFRVHDGSKPVACGASEMQNVICEALLTAFPMSDKIADNYAAVAVKALSALTYSIEEPAANKGEQRTICESCGNSNLAHERAVWTDDGSSFCPACIPQPKAVTEEMRARIIDALEMSIPHTFEFDAESGGYYDTDLSRELRELSVAMKEA